jgi:hypothetical protein
MPFSIGPTPCHSQTGAQFSSQEDRTMANQRPPDPNDRPAKHAEPAGRRAARTHAHDGIEGSEASAYGQEFDSAEDRSNPITGFDAENADADAGSAGNGASRFGGDYAGLARDVDDEETQTSLSADPSHPEDILPTR